MRRVRFDDDRAAGRESRCRVSAGDGECQREIARAEDRDRADRDQHAADVRFRQRRALREARDRSAHRPTSPRAPAPRTCAVDRRCGRVRRRAVASAAPFRRAPASMSSSLASIAAAMRSGTLHARRQAARGTHRTRLRPRRAADRRGRSTLPRSAANAPAAVKRPSAASTGSPAIRFFPVSILVRVQHGNAFRFDSFWPRRDTGGMRKIGLVEGSRVMREGPCRACFARNAAAPHGELQPMSAWRRRRPRPTSSSFASCWRLAPT